jgi:flagellar motor switch protein FliG
VSAATTSAPGPREAAVVLVALGPERAAAVLRGLGEQQARQLAAEVAALGPVDPTEVRDRLVEVVRALQSPSQLPAPGKRMAKELLVRALGPEVGHALGEELDSAIPFSWLEHADPAAAGRALGAEAPGAVALALAHLSPRTAARLLTCLPPEAQGPVATRIAALGAVHPDTVRHVDESLRGRVAELLQTEVRRVDGPELLAGLLAKTPGETSKELLQAVAATDPELAAATRDRLFTFDDLCALEPRTLQVVLRAIEAKQLALALRNLPEDTVATVLGNLSERARETLLEEIDLLGSVRTADVLAARAAAVAAARQLEDEGSVVLAREEEA